MKRLHQLIMDINNQKLKAQQDKIDQIDKEMDECSSAITKGQVAARTADRYCIHCLGSVGLREGKGRQSLEFLIVEKSHFLSYFPNIA